MNPLFEYLHYMVHNILKLFWRILAKFSLKGTRRRVAASTNACANPAAAASKKGEEKEGGRRQTRRGTAKTENEIRSF